VNPTQSAEFTIKKNPTLGGDFFIVWFGTIGANQTSVTFHRPIGKTRLGKDVWVATPSSELGFLCERQTSQEVAAWQRRLAQYIRAQVLASQMGRKLDNSNPPKEVWNIQGAPECAPQIKLFQQYAVAAGKTQADWLDYAPQEVKTAEGQFKTALNNAQALQAAFEADNPEPAFETKGGPAGDRPQVAVTYLTGMNKARAFDQVRKRVMGVESQSDSEAEED